MGTWPRHAVLATIAVVVVAVSTVGIPTTGAVSAQSADPADIREVMLDQIDGFELTDEGTVQAGAFTRQFSGSDGVLLISGFAVATPPGAQVLFERLPPLVGFDYVAHPTIPSAQWMVATDTVLGQNVAGLAFATRDHIFTIIFSAADPSFDAQQLVEAVARRQIEQAGGQATDTATDTGLSDVERRLSAMIPEQPPPGYGLESASLRLPGFAGLENDGVADPGVVSFLNDHAEGLTAAWASSTLSDGVGITQYPYEIFAASDLAQYAKLPPATIPAGAPAPPRNAVVFQREDDGLVGVAFRRGELLVLVLTGYTAPDAASTATSLAIEEANLVAPNLPDGRSTPYTFPTPPSRLTGLALTAGLVVAAVGGATFVARLRARRVRRAWSTDHTPAVWPNPRPGVELVQLDDDAAVLRRRGAIVAVVQLVTIVIGVVALAGDFAWRGVFVAVSALLVGLVFSHWWLRREHELLGPSAPPRAFRVPRPAGAVMGVVAFAVLGFGVGFLLKGVRYLIFKPTLAQLKWSDLLGLAPRDVGILFTIGGLLVAMLGAVLWRIARRARSGPCP